ncbi:MAG: 2-C-methyl-D-erythritol 2,4-cyclodiphosphate synthase [Clostridia bacterium]|nr:2-C-methyl-D-erythritol 2,4-cyclodiphosphate synthase [Clostridia bacterium]
MDLRIGNGYDVHRLVPGRKLMLGCVEVPHDSGLLGHSDADVLCHAIADAMLGAAGMGDIGRHFPDNDPSFEGVSGAFILSESLKLCREKGYHVSNVDAVIIAQRPKLASFLPEMARRIAAALQVDEDRVNVKATTEEKLGFTGREEGIAAHAVCLLVREPANA